MTNTLDEAIARQLGRPLYELINKHLADGQQAEATLARVHAYAVHAIDAGDTGPGPTLGRLLLQLLDGDTAATEATRPTTWLTAGTRDLSIPEQHQFTARPVDPEEERAASDRARRVGAEAQRASEQLAALGTHTGLVVQPYRNDQGQPAWVFRCWGTDTCNGWLSLDHSSQQSAERARDRREAEDHAPVTEPPAQDGGPDVAEAAHDDRTWDARKAGE